MKKILLIDTDSKIPNIALMKLSAMYKNTGHKVKLLRLNMRYYPPNKSKIVLAHGYGLTCISTVFTPNKGLVKVIGSPVIIGGTGESLSVTLSRLAEKQKPDYSIYPECDYSIGFISRGCPKKCSFCFVPEKEGKLRQVATPVSIIQHKKVMFLDNNFLALQNHKSLLREISSTNAVFQFKQGLDVRLLDEQTASLLAKSRLWGALYFAYDFIEQKKVVEKNLLMMALKISKWRIRVYLYVHPKFSLKGVLHRIKFCIKNKILPYVMRDLECWQDVNRKDFWVDLAAWANQPSLVKNMLFMDFLKKRHLKNYKRIKKSNLFFENKVCKN